MTKKISTKVINNPVISEDISKIDSADIPNCDIIIGGFPCQGFSVANMKRHVDDERNELYKQLIRVIDEKRPKFFLAENVKGLTNLDKGKVFEMILSDFKKLGYKVKAQVLNAADYGVPQTRQRVIIVGVRNDIDFENNIVQVIQNTNASISLSNASISIPVENPGKLSSLSMVPPV